MVLILVGLLLGQTAVHEGTYVPSADRPDRQQKADYRAYTRGSGRSGAASAFSLQFAVAGGAGMKNACDCTAITGTRGEVLTMTRASTATCTKTQASSGGGLTLTGIANGDLVTCSSNQPRVEWASNGVRGLLTEYSATNSALWSQAINTAPWVDEIGTGGTAPTLSGADAATDPYGNLTAEWYTFAATAGTQNSARAQPSASIGVWSAGVYVKGQAGSGTMDICLQTGAGTASCAACNYVSGSWTRCAVSGVTSVAAGSVYIGNMTAFNGGTARAANSVYISQVDVQNYPYITSPIPTTTVSVTRAQENASFPVVNGVTSQGSAAATFSPMTANYGGSTAWGPTLVNGSTARFMYFGTTMAMYDGTNNPTLSFGTLTYNTPKRFASNWFGTTMNMYNITDSTSFTSAFTGTMTPGTALDIGSSTQMGAISGDGITTSVCLDSNPLRCR